MLPRLDQPFILTLDASTKRIGWTLSQKDENNRERVISYGGSALSDAETRYIISELECPALVHAVRENYTGLATNQFYVLTNHVTLKYLQTMKLSSNNRLARWALFLKPYQMRIIHKSGKTNFVADALSQIP